MDEPRRATPAASDGRWGPSPGWLLAAIGLVAGAVAAWWTAVTPAAPPPVEPGVAAASAPSTPQVAAAPPAASASSPASIAPPGLARASAPAGPRIARVREAGADQTPDISDFVNDGETPTMGEVIARLHAAGVHTGLGAFNPPGTRPPLVGLAVPENFPLPPGYVRHYQATDDGQRIEPILMFAPDFQPRDANGQPVAMPADRVVTPELAPPGLPIRRITVPAPPTR